MLRYAAAVVLVAGLGSGLGVGLPPPVAQAMAVARPASRQLVFVDVAELARLHPGWQALNDMKAALAGAGSASTSAGPTQDRGATAIIGGGAGGRSRSELVAKAARDASAALDALESRKYTALRARGEAMKSQSLKSSEADWKTEARNIEQAAAAETRSVDDRYSSDLVNARLRASASETEFKVSRIEGSGMDKDAANERLQRAQADLAGVGSANDAEKDRIMAAANAKIEALRQASEKRVEQQVGAYESEQSKLIAEDMAAARDEIARELGPMSTPALFARRWNGLALGDSGVGASRTDGLADLKAAASALRARIDTDVSSMALDLAAKKGLKVTFERPRGATRDATQVLVGLIKEHGWKK